jgi:hypothetical protein
LWLWYFFVYLPYSNKKERDLFQANGKKYKKLPKWIIILNVINKFFLVDLIFNVKEFSTDMLVIAKK